MKFIFRLFAPVLLASNLLTGCSNANQQSQGYVEGEYRYISANFAGTLQQLTVQRGDQIKAGQLLFTLEQQPEIAQLKQAEQQVQEDTAGLELAQIEYKRQQALFRKNATDKDSLDKARTKYLQAKATLENVQAALTQAQWTHQQKTVTAPIAARVFDTYYLPGELVPANHPVLSLLAAQDIKIIFYITEPQLSQIKLGQTVKINCDNCQQTVNATINYISPEAEYTPPVIYSNETRNKLVFHIEAVPSLVDAEKLHPGQPVDVTWN